MRHDDLSVYLLQALQDAGMVDHMCIKDGNSFRKIFARKLIPPVQKKRYPEPDPIDCIEPAA